MYFHKSRKTQQACAELRLTQTAFPYSSVALQPIRVKETGVIAELTVFTLSVVSNFHFLFSIQFNCQITYPTVTYHFMF